MTRQDIVRLWDYRVTMSKKIKSQSKMRENLARNLQRLMDAKEWNDYDMARKCQDEVSRGTFQNMRKNASDSQISNVEVAARLLELKQAWLLLSSQEDEVVFELVQIFNETSQDGREHILKSLSYPKEEIARLKQLALSEGRFGRDASHHEPRDYIKPATDRRRKIPD